MRTLLLIALLAVTVPCQAQQAAPTDLHSPSIVSISGQLQKHLLGNPTLLTADNKTLKLTGRGVAAIQQTKNADRKKIELQGQLLDDGKVQMLVVSSFRMLEPLKVGTIPQNGLPPAYGIPSISGAMGAPPQRETYPPGEGPK